MKYRVIITVSLTILITGVVLITRAVESKVEIAVDNP